MENVTVECGVVSESICVDGGVDVDVTVSVDGEEIEGEVTLVRHEVTGEFASWGQPDHWVSGALLARINAREDARDILTELSAATSAAAN